MELKDVLTEHETTLIKKFAFDEKTFRTVKKALLLSFYFRKGEVKCLEMSFNDMEKIIDIKNQDIKKGRNPAR